MLHKLKYHFLMHAIILLWGFTGILGKLIEKEALVLVWFRLVIAVVALGLFFLFRRQSLRILERKNLWRLLGIGVLVAMHWVTFYYSIQMSTASLGILCLSTTTLHVTWLEPVFFKKRFSWVEFLFGLAVVCGIYFVSSDFSSKETTALFIGLLSALFAALFSVFNAKVSEEVDSNRMTFYELVSGLIFLSGMLLFTGKFTAESLTLTLSDLLWLLFLGVLCTSFAFIGNIEVLKRLGAFTVTLTINLEPVYTILLAIYILHENESLNNSFYIGSAVIVLVVILNSIVKVKQKTHSSPQEN